MGIKVKVMVVFSNMLFSEGVARLIEDDEAIKVDSLLEAGDECPREKAASCDVILTDFAALDSSFSNLDASKKHGFILLDTDCGRDNLASAIMSKNISGVLLGNATIPFLKKAIRAVAKGEVWIDRGTVKDLLNGVNALISDRLSEKEKEIVALTGKGLRNREIAQRLSISELTVKSHLHRIFKKLEIKTRSQLITYAIKNLAVKNILYGKRRSMNE